ncbi:MAG: hypothetical protein EBS49_07410 [Verrucomicrobia bacterium]|nr:hypothetical protein [Verrucomicrobiota bacterium]
MYRVGVHMAGSPNKQDMDKRSAIGNQFVTGAYTKAEADIISKSAKAMGMKTQDLTSQDSKEQKDTNKVSPVAKIKRNQYGI